MSRAFLYAVISAFFFVFNAVPCFAHPVSTIINGDPASEGEWPWMATLFIHGSNPSNLITGHFCGGALIDPQHVATAAHCAIDLQEIPTALDVVIGRTKLSSNSGTRRNVIGIAVHPQFDQEILINDVAILTLDSPVSETPLPLVEPGDEPLLADGSLATILGWGLKDPDFYVLPDNLQEAEIPIYGDSFCYDRIGRLFDPTYMVCAGKLATGPNSEDGVDTCNGDSGGPLIVQSPSGWKLGGLTSWGFRCAHHKYPGVYTKILKQRDWILSSPPIHPFFNGKPTISGLLNVGEKVVCNPGSIGGQNVQISYQWFNGSIEPIPGATSPEFVFTDTQWGDFVFCEVTASNSTGSAIGDSDFAGPVEGSISDDHTAPIVERGQIKCHKNKCSVRVTVTDGERSSGISSVAAHTVFKPKRNCAGKKSQKELCETLSAGRVFDAAKLNDEDWTFDLGNPPGNGRFILNVVAIDNAGNESSTDFKVVAKVKPKHQPSED